MLEQERQRAAQPIRPMGGVRSSSAANGSARARFAPATHDTPFYSLSSFLAPPRWIRMMWLLFSPGECAL